MKNSLAEKHPELVAEWSERNLPLTPMQISYGSKKLVWWKGSCGHEWQTSVKARSAGERCPICAGVRIVPGINDLATRYPEIAAEWSERNRPLDPQMVSAGSHKKAYWRCRKGHEWLATIKSRTEGGNGCPYCSHRQVLAGYNDLATTDPELVLEWSYDANERKPTEISRLSQYPVWWKGACGHKWKDKVFSRAVEGARCIYCEKEFVQVLPRLLVMVYAKQCGTKVSINDEKTIGTLLDVLLPEVNLAFTFPSRETERGAKVIEVMQYICAARRIQLIEVRKKEPIELAHEIKQAFAKAHLYIDSDSEKEIDYPRKWYFHQTV